MEFLEQSFPDVEIAIAHGKQYSKQLEKTMEKFAQGNIKILICNSKVESGLDIQNANTIIVQDVQQFGLAQLDQMNRFDYRGGDNHTNSDTSTPQSIEIPQSSDSSSKSPTNRTPEDRLRRFKQILPRSALYLLHEEQFLHQAEQSIMRVKKSNRLPQDQDPQVARRAVQKVVERSEVHAAASSRPPRQMPKSSKTWRKTT
ncbi:uncharacterized protein LOC133816949 isoform X2 [Humulus lupulus]|uniref:uncharacterized protein LOC133816949 isoform X2 n=1 Tax=Humulus lupulus TaxID=3486 RepID=UPI002B407CBC|nr:uncharacterized protein LOC133816949 isoform X2 [Humulus lupulus]XP_062105286.1 uncharacterized protein LOC133816949 isoform X2 [Humulus lupulus]